MVMIRILSSQEKAKNLVDAVEEEVNFFIPHRPNFFLLLRINKGILFGPFLPLLYTVQVFHNETLTGTYSFDYSLERS